MAKSTSNRTRSAPFVPAYRRIEANIRARVINGEWGPQSLLPSRRDLAKHYGVEVNTIQKAIGILLQDGLLHAQTGRGTFVADRADVSGVFVPQLRNGHRRPAAQEAPRHILGIIASIAPEPEEMDTNFFWPRLIISGLENSFLQSGQATVLCNIDRGYGTPFLSLRSAFLDLMAKGATVVAIVDVYGAYDPVEIADFFTSGIARDVPTVVISSRTLHGPVPYVSSNLSYGAFLAAEHLLGQGAKELRFVTPMHGGWVDERIEFAREALSFYKQPEDMLMLVRPVAPLPAVGPKVNTLADLSIQLAREMAANGTLRGGIIASSDITALQILHVAAESGLTPGQDFLIVGFDDSPKSVALGLTSVRPPLEELGREADLLLQRVVRHESTGIQVVLQPQLIVRSSSRRIAVDDSYRPSFSSFH